ncbi:hypothetical protein V0U79_06340 [Hyphobacterium sp. HN65]|uniref:Methyl-accepting chemotaxis protein n=1 Tax=Hyphobacterium lacteum TaxID=3116575 RepID=A0ABU7LPY2_9PROT|nr:hypothetical protein [Hyphobacterium sp. HN65]MEE2525979.1 hypothetical protein [Hyphobacterium sp. HN65]
MTKFKGQIETIAAIAQIVASAGVILSVIYLATEVRATTTALNAQTHFNALTLFNDHLMSIVEDEQLADIMHRGDTDPDLLSETEWRRYSELMLVAMNTWEYAYYLHEQNAVPDQLWEGGDAAYRDLAANSRGAQRFWRESRGFFAEPFGSYANQFFPEDRTDE